MKIVVTIGMLEDYVEYLRKQQSIYRKARQKIKVVGKIN